MSKKASEQKVLTIFTIKTVVINYKELYVESPPARVYIFACNEQKYFHSRLNLLYKPLTIARLSIQTHSSILSIELR